MSSTGKAGELKKLSLLYFICLKAVRKTRALYSSWRVSNHMWFFVMVRNTSRNGVHGSLWNINLVHQEYDLYTVLWILVSDATVLVYAISIGSKFSIWGMYTSEGTRHISRGFSHGPHTQIGNTGCDQGSGVQISFRWSWSRDISTNSDFIGNLSPIYICNK